MGLPFTRFWLWTFERDFRLHQTLLEIFVDIPQRCHSVCRLELNEIEYAGREPCGFCHSDHPISQSRNRFRTESTVSSLRSSGGAASFRLGSVMDSSHCDIMHVTTATFVVVRPIHVGSYAAVALIQMPCVIGCETGMGDLCHRIRRDLL